MKTTMHSAGIIIWFMCLARGVLSNCIYVNVSGKNQMSCGSITSPCSSLLFAINNISCHNATICLMASPIKQIRYTVENTIIIKHSLTVTKFPEYSQNPLITYDLNMTSNRKEFYTFTIFRYALAANILTLNISSVNFNVNILTTFSQGFKTLNKNLVVQKKFLFQLLVSISDSIVNSKSHAVNFSDISEHENLTIHMKDLVIKSGDFMFEKKRDRCETSEHSRNMIEMYNVTICNTGNVTLSVHGCFNMSIEKLTCTNITWKERELLIFTGGVLNTKNVLINNILANNNAKYNKTETKAFFLINESVAVIQNILIKDSVGMSSRRPKRFSAVIVVQNSVVQIFNMKMIGNEIRNFVQASKSSLYFKNMTLIENHVTVTLYRVEESNVTLYEIKFHRNKIECLISINLKSKLLIANKILTGNEIFEEAYSVSRSLMKLDNANFRGNKIKTLMLAKSQSRIYVDNITFTNNHVRFRIFDISGESKLKLYNAEFLQNNSSKFLLNSYDAVTRKIKMFGWLLRIESNSSAIIQNNTLIKNNVSGTVCYIQTSSTIQLNHVAFTRNKLAGLLWIDSNSSVIIQNNALIENKFSWGVYFILTSSTIQLNHVAFTRNKLVGLLWIDSNSSAIIQNNTLIENNVSIGVSYTQRSSTIQLNHVAFFRNKLKLLLCIRFNSSAIIQNNTLIENNIAWEVYYIWRSSTIQLNHVAFTRNRLELLLKINFNSNAIIQNNTLIENDISSAVYNVKIDSTIQLNNVEFIRNALLRNLLNIVSSSSAKLINIKVVGNSLDDMFFARSSYLEINTIFIKNNTLSQLIQAVECNVSFKSMKIRENNVTHGMIHVENSAGKMAHTHIENSDYFLASAFKTTSTFLGNRYFPFEITNTEIIWSHKVPGSSRAIIQLSGNVSLSNVKLMVASQFETEILHYSIKDMRLLVDGFLKTFPNIYIISSLFIVCTKARVKHITKAGTFRCIPCAWSTYTLNNESLNISLSFPSKIVTKHENANFTCLNCPVGANCIASIKSKSNFYGYETVQQKLKFLPCPRGFCCSGNQCHTINSCNKNRVGTLCGRCIESYMESFISADCISIHSCQNFAKFWLAYCIYALILATFLYYMKDFITLIQTTVTNFSRIFKSCKEEKESDVEIDIITNIARAEEYLEKKSSSFTVSGIFTLIVSFYQIKQLMKVDVQYKNSSDFSFITFITDCLNLEMIAVTYSSYCPMSNLDALSKVFIKAYLLTATLLMASIINYFITTIFSFFSSKLGKLSSLAASERLGVCFIRILMLSYKNLASSSLILLNCVEVSGVRVLFIKGDMKCYQWWQIVIAVFFLTWILFFPLSLKASYHMFMKDKISFPRFILCLMVPFAAVANYRLNRNTVSVDFERTRNTYEVKVILREIFEESYRIKTVDSRQETVFYETWRLYQRVLLAVVATFCTDPLVRITIMTPIVLLIAICYLVYRPFKPEMCILHWMEVFSVLGIFICLIHNMFRGFLYVYDIKYEYPVTFVWQGFVILDLICSPICVLIYFFIIKLIYNKAKCKIKSFYSTIRWKD